VIARSDETLRSLQAGVMKVYAVLDDDEIGRFDVSREGGNWAKAFGTELEGKLEESMRILYST
jgi:hypothetical protein